MLNLPLLCTLLIEIEENSDSVRRALDTSLARLSELFPCNLPGMTRDGRWLRKADDGIWYVHFGLLRPALAVTDPWIVIGYSPQAVRENVRFLNGPITG